MRAKWNGIVGAILLVCLAGVGCEPKQEPTPLTEEMERQMRLEAPVVGGPSTEFSVPKAPADIPAAVEAALKDSGVNLVQTGGSEANHWLFGKSLADRRVLVQILPVYPGRSTVKVTVEGGDALARDLLKNLSDGIRNRVR